MAVGDIDSSHPWLRSIKVLEGATAATSDPSSSSDGVSLNDLIDNKRPETASVFVVSTAGSGTMDVTLKAWGYNAAAGDWAPLGTNSTAADKGKLNEASKIGETGTNKIAHTEPLDLPRHFTRFYIEITAINNATIDAWLTMDVEGV